MNKNKTLLLTAMLCTTGIVATAQWSLTGNSGTNTTSNFVGTKDNQSLVFRSNNLERMRISNNGFVGIDINKPQALFHLPSKGNLTLTKTDNFLLGDTTAQNLAFDYNKIQARNKRLGNTLQLNPKGGAVAIGNINGTTNPSLYIDTNGTAGAGGQYIQPGYTFTVNQGYTKGGTYLYNPTGSSEKYLLYGENYSSRAGGMFMQNTAVDNQSYVIGARTYGPGTAILGISANSSSFGAGVSGNNEGSGYGVYGYSSGGAALYGHSYDNYGLYASTYNATYAAYFNRSIFVNGNVFTSSDQKLKQNIEEFTSATAIINQLHPKKYQYRQDGDFKLMKLPEGVHYGLIAQEVEKVLPNLVKDTKFDPALETADGDESGKGNRNNTQQVAKAAAINFKAVNYTELIPILIKGIQEQEQKIEALTAQINELREAGTKNNTTFTASGNSLKDQGYLLQNTPNPFKETTTIHYYLPTGVNNAVINIINAAGMLVKSFDLHVHGKSSVVLQRAQLASGTYYYSLIINGKTTDTKKMVLQK